jgi:plastocyanin
MRRNFVPIALLFVAAACGGDTDASPAAGPTLTIQGRSFGVAPETAPGAGFRIDNRDSVNHTFSSVDDLWESVDVRSTSNVEFTVPADLPAGTYDFVCRIHPDMSGRLTVTG